MRTIELTYPHSLHMEELPKTVSAIGFFDGIHQGHQKVITTAVREAEEKEMDSAVITFHPHPSVVLKKDTQQIQYITTLKEKQDVLQELGVDRLYIITFNEQLSKLSPQEFINHFIVGLHIKHLVAGFDYSFGYKGKGNMNNISDYSNGKFTWQKVEQVSLDEEKISSTRIRKELKAGNVDKVYQLLNRPYQSAGMVIKGAQRGRELGYPTANIDVPNDSLLPRQGIYAVYVWVKNQRYEGMANIGTNPTFTEDRQDVSVEVYIFDYSNDLYGEELIIEWLNYVRPEERFDTVEALINRMKEDEQEIRSYLTRE
ncbi:bifunctional riboflavin kinase/FAD synthetase [Oceanobacillus iheyensis]|uniref:bifunctional riboflavin kinase/FAD synthetase n=1 Tax=Oceanobacillus iheyensis TaxID=182710 RepID=UPI00364517F6